MEKKGMDMTEDGFKARLIEVLKGEPVNYWMEALDASRSVISHKWIKGTTVPRSDFLWKICEVKELSANWLFYNHGSKYLADLDKATPKAEATMAADRFMRLFPVEVQDFITSAVRLIPEQDQADNVTFLTQVLHLLINYLKQEKTRTLSASEKDQMDFEMQLDREGNLVQCNAKMLTNFGLDPQKNVGIKYNFPVDPKDSERFNDALAKLSQNEPMVHVRVRMEMPTGVSEWQEWDFAAEFDELGKHKGIKGIGIVVQPSKIRKR